MTVVLPAMTVTIDLATALASLALTLVVYMYFRLLPRDQLRPGNTIVTDSDHTGVIIDNANAHEIVEVARGQQNGEQLEVQVVPVADVQPLSSTKSNQVTRDAGHEVAAGSSKDIGFPGPSHLTTPSHKVQTLPVTPPATESSHKETRARTHSVRSTTPIRSPPPRLQPSMVAPNFVATIAASTSRHNAPVVDAPVGQTKGKGKGKGKAQPEAEVQVKAEVPAPSVDMLRYRNTRLTSFPTMSSLTSVPSSRGSTPVSVVSGMYPISAVTLSTASSSSWVPSVSSRATTPASARSVSFQLGHTDDDAMEVDGYYRRIVKQRSGPRQVGQEEPDVVETSWFTSSGPNFIAGPPSDDNLENPMVGDVFLHFATKYNPPIYQLFVRLLNEDSTSEWRLVEPGFTRADGRMLIVTKTTKEASWVKESQFKSVMRAEHKARGNQ